MASVPRPNNPLLATSRRNGARPSTPTGTRGSATQTITSNDTTDRPAASADSLVLRLRGSHNPSLHSETSDIDENASRITRRRRIQWDENVVDNEGLGRKKSKVCCIYHKPRAVGESSDESSSDSESDSDSGSDVGDGARPARGYGRNGKSPQRDDGDEHDHKDADGCNGLDHTHGHGHRHRHDGDSGRRLKKSRRQPSPNAYEKMPKYDVKPLTKQPGV